MFRVGFRWVTVLLDANNRSLCFLFVVTFAEELVAEATNILAFLRENDRTALVEFYQFLLSEPNSDEITAIAMSTRQQMYGAVTRQQETYGTAGCIAEKSLPDLQRCLVELNNMMATHCPILYAQIVASSLADREVTMLEQGKHTPNKHACLDFFTGYTIDRSPRSSPRMCLIMSISLSLVTVPMQKDIRVIWG